MQSFIKLPYLAIVSSLVITAGVSVLHAQETSEPTVTKPVEAVDPLSQLKKINETLYKLGEITIDKKTRAISFEAEAEITAALVEYAIVTPEGKIHEALFVTKARPIHLNIAFKLLGYKENKSLYRLFVNDLPTEKYQTSTEEEKAKSLFTTTISWVDKKTKKTISHNMNELIKNAQTDKTLAADKAPWSYGGSFIHQGKFVAEMNNDLIAIFTDRGAVANYAGNGREDDTLWHPVTEKMPVYGTKVTITITPQLAVDKKK